MCTVLLVEDSAVQQVIICRRIAFADVVPVGTIFEAQQRLADGCQFDVVILDLGLPDIQGLETFLAIKSYCENVPVIIYTAEDCVALALECIRQGAETVLLKPDVSALERTVAYATEKRRRCVALQKQVAAKMHDITCAYAQNITTAKETLRSTAKQLGKDEPWQETKSAITRNCS